MTSGLDDPLATAVLFLRSLVDREEVSMGFEVASVLRMEDEEEESVEGFSLDVTAR